MAVWKQEDGQKNKETEKEHHTPDSSHNDHCARSARHVLSPIVNEWKRLPRVGLFFCIPPQSSGTLVNGPPSPSFPKPSLFRSVCVVLPAMMPKNFTFVGPTRTRNWTTKFDLTYANDVLADPTDVPLSTPRWWFNHHIVTPTQQRNVENREKAKPSAFFSFDSFTLYHLVVSHQYDVSVRQLRVVPSVSFLWRLSDTGE